MALLGIVQVNVVHNVAGRETTNTLYYNHVAGGLFPYESTLLGLQSAFFDTVWNTHWKPVLSHRSRLVAISLDVLFPVAIPGLSYPYVGQLGSILSDTIPTNAAGLISFKNPNGIRNFNRRLYLAGLPESQVNDSLISFDLFASLNALGDKIGDQITLPNPPTNDIFDPVAFSRKRVADLDPVVFVPLSPPTVTVATRTQRNRALRVDI